MRDGVLDSPLTLINELFVTNKKTLGLVDKQALNTQSTNTCSKSRNRRTRAICEICSSFLLLALNRFHTFRRFHCCLWTSKCRLGRLNCRLEQSDFFSQWTGRKMKTRLEKPVANNFKAYRWQKWKTQTGDFT